jgi:acyl homoserine lactone synthase
MIYLVTPENYFLHRDDLDAMYRLRHKIFFEKLNWQVKSDSGMEKDEYDENNTYYLIYKDKNNIVRGCQRYISMINSCMFDGPFDFILQNLKDFKKPEYWEASRLAVDYDYDEHYTKEYGITVCQGIFAASLHFALKQGIKKFLTLSYPSVARILSQHFSTSLVASSTINGEEIVVTSYPPLKESYEKLLVKLNHSPAEPIYVEKTI